MYDPANNISFKGNLLGNWHSQHYPYARLEFRYKCRTIERGGGVGLFIRNDTEFHLMEAEWALSFEKFSKIYITLHYII